MNSPPVRHSPIDPVPSPWNAPANDTKVPTLDHFFGWSQLIGDALPIQPAEHRVHQRAAQ